MRLRKRNLRPAAETVARQLASEAVDDVAEQVLSWDLPWAEVERIRVELQRITDELTPDPDEFDQASQTLRLPRHRV